MKSLFFVLFMGLVGGIYAQTADSRYPADAVAAAKAAGEAILFEKSTIELGEIKKGSFPELTFRFLNISEEDVRYNFFDVCSCSILTHDEDAVIKPGEEGTFHIKFDSKEREDEEPVPINFELKNIDKRNNYPYFYTVNYTFSFAK